MKSVFDLSTKEELIKRINSLGPQNTAQWGKMDVYQMLRHCTLCDDMFLGTLKLERVFIGRLIGSMMLKKVLKGNTPFSRNAPTSPVLKTTSQTGNIDLQKKEWISRIERFSGYDHPGFVHPFFGAMTREQVGLFAYKHADHHLRQFGA